MYCFGIYLRANPIALYVVARGRKRRPRARQEGETYIYICQLFHYYSFHPYCHNKHGCSFYLALPPRPGALAVGRRCLASPRECWLS